MASAAMIRSWVIALLLLGSIWTQTVQAREYVLGRGDLIRIQVYGEDELSFDTRVDENGTITYPFLGKVRLKDRTTSQIEKKIDRGLRGDYLINPEVQVRILEYRSFYVNGQVNNPGGYPYVPGLTVIKAISLAGGFNKRASESRIVIVRERDPKQKRYRVKLDTAVYPGDTLTIGESLF